MASQQFSNKTNALLRYIEETMLEGGKMPGATDDPMAGKMAKLDLSNEEEKKVLKEKRGVVQENRSRVHVTLIQVAEMGFDAVFGDGKQVPEGTGGDV